jgi:hypothetical protein
MDIQIKRRRLLLLGTPFVVLFLVATVFRISGQVQAANPLQVQGRYHRSQTLVIVHRLRAESKRNNGLVHMRVTDLNMIELQLTQDFCR